jgi:competence protein ComGC
MVESLNCYNGKNLRRRGCGNAFTLTELLVVVACVVLLAAILLPAIAKRYAMSSRADCQNNLKQIGLAYRTWEGDYSDKYPAHVLQADGGVQEAASNAYRSFQVMSNELNNPRIVVCPMDDARQPGSNFTHFDNQNVSYFVGLDSDETKPVMLLSGDRNLITNGVPVVPGLVVIRSGDKVEWSGTMHKFMGNIGLADGSVQQVSSASLQKLFQQSGTNVNRLAMP